MRFAQQVAVHAPARGAGDHQAGLVALEQVGVQAGVVAHLEAHQPSAGSGRAAQDAHRGAGSRDEEAARPALLGFDLLDVAVHGFGVDAPRAADTAQVGQPPLHLWGDAAGIFFGLLEAQALNDQARLAEAGLDLFQQGIIGEQDDFHAGIQQGGQHIALQEVNHSQAVVGGDEDSFCHK